MVFLLSTNIHIGIKKSAKCDGYGLVLEQNISLPANTYVTCFDGALVSQQQLITNFQKQLAIRVPNTSLYIDGSLLRTELYRRRRYTEFISQSGVGLFMNSSKDYNCVVKHYSLNNYLKLTQQAPVSRIDSDNHVDIICIFTSVDIEGGIDIELFWDYCVI
jgi:hypothetical protein